MSLSGLPLRTVVVYEHVQPGTMVIPAHAHPTSVSMQCGRIHQGMLQCILTR